ncbi:MAG TPA: GerMN domain-containing protein [Geodermatophilus sp.]|nr:GerMN domain-containing protein [Geodermatophilus sp.]
MSPRPAAVAGVLLALVAGCGISTGGTPEPIPASDVPYGLLSPSPSPSAPTDPGPTQAASLVYLLAGEDTLVPRAREVGGGSLRERLDDLLGDLAEGPNDVERRDELSTALPPDVSLTVAEIAGTTATVDIAGPADAPSGWASRRAVAQIVLTATSLDGVDAVRLTLGGEPVDAPLPSGELTSEPLTAEDYAVFLGVPPAPPS